MSFEGVVDGQVCIVWAKPDKFRGEVGLETQRSVDLARYAQVVPKLTSFEGRGQGSPHLQPDPPATTPAPPISHLKFLEPLMVSRLRVKGLWIWPAMRGPGEN